MDQKTETNQVLVNIQFTMDEIKVVQEALEDWIKSVDMQATFAGLVGSALFSQDGKDTDRGRELRAKCKSESEKITLERKRKAYAILAKL